MSGEQIVIEIQDKIPTSIENKITGIGNAAKASNSQILILQKNLNIIDKNAIASERLAIAQTRAKTASQQLAAATDRAALSSLRLSQAQARAEASNKRFEASSQSVGTSLASLVKQGLTIAGISLGIREILDLGNAYLDLTNKLKVVTTSQEQLATVSSRVFEIANVTRTSVEATAKAFSRFDLALIQLGASQNESLRMTETINKALIVSGAGIEEQSAALLQLSQAFNKGKLDGDEFRSVMELMPSVADAIAKQLGVTRGELLKLAPQGKITAEIMRQALSSAAIEIDAKFAKTLPTLSQGFTNLRNDAINAFGDIEKETGILGTLSTEIISLGQSFKKISPDIAILLNSIGELGSTINSLVPASINGGNALISLRRTAQGVGLIFALVSDSITAVNTHLDELHVDLNKAKLKEAILTLQNYQKLNRESSNEIISKEAIGSLEKEIVLLKERVEKDKEHVKNLSQMKLATEKWADAVAKSDENVKQLEETEAALKPIKEKINELTSSYVELEEKIKRASEASNKSSDNVKNLNAQKIALENIRKEYDKLIEKKNILSGGTSALRPSGPAPKKAIDENEVRTAETRAQILAKIVSQLERESEAFGKVNPERDAYLKLSAIEIQLENTKIGKKKESFNLQEKERQMLKEKIDANEKNKVVQAELERINTEANGSLIKYNATLEASSILLKDNLITQDQYNQRMLIAKNVYETSINPLSEINKSLTQEFELLNFVGKEQEIQNRLQQIRNELLSKGIPLEGNLLKNYNEQLIALQQKNALNKEQNLIMDATIGKSDIFKAKLEALTLLINSGASNLEMGVAKTTLFGSIFDGTEEAFETELNSYQVFYDEISKLRANNLISEKTAFQLRQKAEAEFNEKRLMGSSEFFGTLAQLQSSGSKELFEIGKAAAIAQATIDGIAGVQKALGSLPPPYSFAMAGAVALVAGANVARIASTSYGGFKDGGFTGNVGTSEVAGVVHGKEFVLNANATARNRPMLEAMNSGKSIAPGSSQVSVKIENYGTSKDFEVQQTNEGEIRIIARDEASKIVRRDVPGLMASEIANPNSPTSKSLNRNTATVRRR